MRSGRGPDRRCVLLAALGAAAAGSACTTVRLEDDLPPALAEAGEVAFVPGSLSGEDYAGGETLHAAIARVHELACRLRLRATAALLGRAPLWGLVVLDADLLDALRLPAGEAGSGVAMVAHVAGDSPAARAGLARGDLIERVGTPDDGAAGDTPRRRLLARAAAAAPIELQLRRGDERRTVVLQPADAAALTPVLMSDRVFVWQGDALPLAQVDDTLLAFAIAHQAAMRRQAGRTRRVAAPAQAGEAVDLGLSAVSLLLGIATLGGWSAKPVDIFDDRSSAAQRADARIALWREAVLAADRSAFEVMRAAGFDPQALLRAWPLQAEPREDGSESPRLRALRDLASR